MIRSVIPVLCLLAVAATASAQIHGGLQGGISSYLGASTNMVFVGAFGEYERSESMGFRLSAAYATGSKDENYTAFSTDTAQFSGSIVAPGTTDITSIGVALDWRKYLGEGSYESGGVYGFLGLGATFGTAQTTYDFGTVPVELVSVTGEADEQEAQQFTQIVLRGGVGYEVAVKSAKVFIEARLNFPANNLDAPAIPIDLGPNAGVSIGFRL